MCEARFAEGFFFALRKSHWGIGIKSLKPITISTFSPKDGYLSKILHNYSRKAARFFGKAKGRVKEGGEGRKEVKAISLARAYAHQRVYDFCLHLAAHSPINYYATRSYA